MSSKSSMVVTFPYTNPTIPLTGTTNPIFILKVRSKLEEIQGIW
jgi:hypothetical protein